MKIGSYQLLKRIGKGGMGDVYKGRHQEDPDTLAIKILKLDEDSDPLSLIRFEKEFKAANHLNHPNIVRAIDFGIEGNLAYLVMEYIDGCNLNQIVLEQGRLWQLKATELFLHLAEGVGHAHEHQLVHRDIKPGNIMVTQSGKAMLTDFGLVKDLETEENITRSRMCLGTLHFMAPEQYENAKRATPACDIYSLGASLYYAVTAEVPFLSNSGHLATLNNKLKHKVVHPKHVVPNMSTRLARLILQSLNPNPEERPKSCQAFSTELRAIREMLLKKKDETNSVVMNVVRKPEKAVDRERRLAERFLTERQAHCAIVPELKIRWETTIRDISASGIRLHLKRRFEPGTLLSLHVLNNNGQDTTSFWISVCRAAPLTDGRWELGCTFDSPLEECVLEDLLDCHSTVVVAHE